MAQRTSETKVRAIIDGDDSLNVAPFIDTAVAVTDYVASQDTNSILSTAMLLEIETYLAAHYYEHLDRKFERAVTGDAEATFQGKFAMGLDSSKWGQTAKRMDITGTLAAMDTGKGLASITWLGKPVSEQTAYEDRD